MRTGPGWSIATCSPGTPGCPPPAPPRRGPARRRARAGGVGPRLGESVTPAGARPADAAARVRGVADPAIVGRQDEQRQLRAAFEEAGDGRGGLLVLVGEAGIGK